MLDLSELQMIAKQMASAVKKGDVICLKGDLGVGKTQFAKFFIQALTNMSQEIPSPTFSLVQIYEGLGCEIWHFDLYRIELVEEIYEIGLEQALSQGISIIEWPDIVEKLLPKPRLEVQLNFSKSGENFRDVNIIEVK
jgi:tRNA threonylcarbamoyladenosine biosynthesis protein TsaE